MSLFKLTSTYFLTILYLIINSGMAIADKIELPFYNINGYTMIAGSVNGTEGKFLFDTGTPFDFLINNNMISLDKNVFFGAGNATSGQSIVIFKQRKATCINVAYGKIQNNIENIKHADFEFIEKGISPYFLGMIGKTVVAKTPFLIDYSSQTIIIYDNLPDLDVGTITITTTADHLPQSTFAIGDREISVFFDSGAPGNISLTEETMLSLEKNGSLVVKNAESLHGEPGNYLTADLKNIKYGIHDLKNAYNLHLEIGAKNKLTIGYSLLKDYKLDLTP